MAVLSFWLQYIGPNSPFGCGVIEMIRKNRVRLLLLALQNMFTIHKNLYVRFELTKLEKKSAGVRAFSEIQTDLSGWVSSMLC